MRAFVDSVKSQVGSCPLFAMQVLVSAAGLALTTGMLATGRDPAVYLPVLTSIVAYWLPAPKRPFEQAPLTRQESVASIASRVPAAVVNDTAENDDDHYDHARDADHAN